MKFLLIFVGVVVSAVFAEDSTQATQVQETDTSNLTPTYTYPGLHPSYQPASNQPTYQSTPNQPTYQVNPAYSDPYYQAGYGAYYPATQKYPENSVQESGMVRTMATILSTLRQSFAVVIKILGKIGLVVSAGAAVLVIGGALTALLCSLTPYCTLTFMGYGLSKEEVRSFMTPDNINMVGNLLGQAIDKYNTLQKTVEVKNI